ncbi:MAG: hypothetical protein ACRDP6_38915, partial [Actinoallomurus sp.]
VRGRIGPPRLAALMEDTMTELPMPDASEMEKVLDAAFDEFVAAGNAPWLVARIGAGVPSAPSDQVAATLPANALDVPRLESGLFPGTLGERGEWFQPDLALSADADPAFGFAAIQTGEVAADGGPFNRATLTFSLRAIKPAGLTAFPELEPMRQVPDLRLGLTLTVPVTTPDGSTRTERVPGTATAGGGGGFVATFELTGPVVEAAYAHLTHRGQAGLEIAATYTGYETTLITAPDLGFPVPGPVFHGYQFEVFGDGGITPLVPIEVVHPMPGTYRFYPVTASFTRAVPVGLAFHADVYRSRFTITAENLTRPIIDAGDLAEFAHTRSEYRELTTLGDIATKYPSLRRLYFGQISGTVVAVPAAYGILRTAQGLLATCDSIVDDSPVTLTGCRFHFTFTIVPMADPVDLARLRAAVPGIPEAAGRTLRVILPTGLDPRNPSSLDGFPAASAAFADGQESAVQVGIDIADDQATPATTNVNLFLQQLASTGPAPLFGNVAIRLDDAYPQPVHAQLALNLRQTFGRDDLRISVQAGNPPTAQATNQGPFDLVLHRFAAVAGQLVNVVSLGDPVLPAGESTTLTGIEVGESVEMSYGLAVPSPLPKAAMSKYVTFHTHTVQEVQHPLTVNAAGLDLAATGITTIDIQITITANPATPVPAMTLSPSHLIDFVHVMVPVDSVVTGLDSTVALTLTTAAGRRTVTVSHDFVEEPILVLTPSTIA